MGLHNHKRRKSAYAALLVCAGVLLSNLSLCFAECTARNSTEPVADEPGTPPCHGEPLPADSTPDSGAPVCSQTPSTAICCCLINASSTAPAELTLVAAPRGATPTVFALASSHIIHPPFFLASHIRTGCDSSPPGAPLFIAHHALLI